jgi:hypothetical protein
MTYQTTMTTSAPFAAVQATLAHIGSFLLTVGRAMARNSSMQGRLDLVRALEAKTDDELAALKIRRDQIVHHVFKDLYYA